jgi:ABC-2 type transport system permease protein
MDVMSIPVGTTFDPQLVLLGPTAYVILDNFEQAGYITQALPAPGSVSIISNAAICRRAG